MVWEDVINTITYFNEIGPSKKRNNYKKHELIDIWKVFPVGFFDGVCSTRKCGYGAFIVIELDNFFHFWWEGGQGTNNKAKIIAMWGVRIVAKWLGMKHI